MAFVLPVADALNRVAVLLLTKQLAGVLLLGAAVFLGARSAAGNTGAWQLEVNDLENDIQVYSRQLSDTRTEFRGVTRLKTSLSSLVALLKDVERLPQWAYRTVMAIRIETVSPREAIVYSVAELSWPFKDRDLVVRTRLTQDPVSLSINVSGEAVPDYLPVDPNYVRVPFLKSSWAFEPAGDGIVEIEFRGYGDGGGSLSNGFLSWVSQQLVSQAPHESLIGLRRMVVQARYQQAILPFIKEPVASATASSSDNRVFREDQTGSE